MSTPLKIATQAIVLETLKERLPIHSTSPKPIVAMVMRYQTNGIAEMLINAPRMAVNPKMITIK